jgi:hypothetical protein
MEDADIIERVEGPTPWVSPIVVVPKPHNPREVRICVDMRQPNKAIGRERHISPTIDDIISELGQAKVFSKLDLNQGYHQLELAPESRYITTKFWRIKDLINLVKGQLNILVHYYGIWFRMR